MGIWGLLSTCLQRQEECTDMVDLIEVARSQDGIELLVDFYAFEHYVLNKFWAGLSRLRGNNYLKILGGEYGTLDSYLTKLVEDLKCNGIHLVFYVDGGKGSSTDTLRQKLDTWIRRHEDDIDTMTQLLDVCRGNKRITDLPIETNIRPVSLEDQFMAVLRKCGCVINQCPAGEADLLIARALKERSKAYAVLSNDSDFCIFKGCRFIPVKLFDIENDLQLGEAVELPERPLRLKVKVITMEKVMSMLKINNHETLIELAIVAGNDYTGPFMRGPDGLHYKLDVRGRRSIDNFADWIHHYGNIQNHHILGKEMHQNSDFRNAVYYCRNFYSLKGDNASTPRKGHFSKLIEEGILSGQYTSNMMSMHNNFYWYRMLLEDNSYGAPCAECAYTQLRAYIYRIVLPRQESLVNEYGRSPYENLRKAGIFAVADGQAPPIHHINSDKIFQNLRHFHNIMSHQERGNCSTNWFDRYGRKNGFVVYLLRYFLHVNWGYNLHLSENEFLALVAVVFGHRKESEYQTIVLRPTVRCVTIGNWYQDLYRHAYTMLGSLLYLKHEFPLPSEVFCGSVWTAMFMVCQDQTFYMAADQVPLDVLYKTQEHMNAIIKEKRHMIKYIVQGFFPFDDR